MFEIFYVFIFCISTYSICVCSVDLNLVVGDVIKHLLDLDRVLHRGGDGVGRAEGINLHRLKTFPQEEVLLGEGTRLVYMHVLAKTSLEVKVVFYTYHM